MGIQAAQLYALVSVAGASQSASELQRVGNAVNTAQGKMAGLGANARQMATGVKQVAGGMVRLAEIAGVAIGGAVAASAKVASTFQAEMELIHTQAGALQSEVDSQTKAVLDLAHSVGTAPEELAKGLYHIESVGLRGAQALDVLRAGALGAKTGLASMEETTNALTAIQFSGIAGVNNMTEAMGALDGIVGTANVRLGDFVEALGTGILGTAKTFGVSLQSVGAAFAVLSDAGVKASPAMTRMQMMFTHMAAPTNAALKIFKKLGLDQFALAEDLRKPDGIFVALDDLRTHLIKTGEMVNGVLTPQGTADIAKIFGGSRFGAAAMQLLQMADRIPQKFAAINVQQQQFGERIQATMETTRFKWGQFLGDLQTAAIKFGTQINPALARGLGHVDDFLVAHFGDIEQAGRELGAAIDKIDWTKVEDGAKSFLDIVKKAFDLISHIPVEIDAMVVSFLGLNKLSGGLLGTGVGNIAGGLAKGIAGALTTALGRVPGLGGAVNAVSDATAMRVHVTNFPPGFGVPGGPAAPMIQTAADEFGWKAVMGGLLKLLPWMATLPFILGGDSPGTNGASPMVQQLTDALKHNQTDLTPGGQTYAGLVADLEKSMSAEDIAAAMAAMADAATSTVDLTNAIEDADHAIRGNTDALHAHAASLGAKPAWLLAWEKSVFGAHLRTGIVGAEKNLITGQSLLAAARFLGANVGTGGVGGGGTGAAKRILDELQSSLLKTSDPATRRAITEAIAKIEKRLPTLDSNSRNLHAAEAIAASNETQAQKLADLTAIQKDVKLHGDRLTRARVDALIAQVKHHPTTWRIAGDTIRIDAEWITPGAQPLVSTYYAPTDSGKVIGTLATGAVGIAKSPTQAIFGEAGAEGVAIIRNPRPFDPTSLHGGVRVDVRPQPVSLRINGREIVHGVLLSNAFVRGAETA